MLNPIRARINCSRGKPNSLSTDANPSPCSKPKPNIIIGRHSVSFEENKFSRATYTIETAINGSTILAGTLTISNEPRANVKVCARVKALTCHKSTPNRADRKNKPSTNKI